MIVTKPPTSGDNASTVHVWTSDRVLNVWLWSASSPTTDIAGEPFIRWGRSKTPDPSHPAADYIHNNPVRRRRVAEATQWKWSSARWYASNRELTDPDLPTIHGLPWDFFV